MYLTLNKRNQYLGLLQLYKIEKTFTSYILFKDRGKTTYHTTAQNQREN